MCYGIKIVRLGCEKQSKLAQNGQKTTIFQLFSIFSKTVHTIRTKFSTVILHHFRVLYVQWHQNRMAGMRNIAKISPKMAKKHSFFDLIDFLKNCPYDSNEILYSHSTPCYGPLCVIFRVF